MLFIKTKYGEYINVEKVAAFMIENDEFYTINGVCEKHRFKVVADVCSRYGVHDVCGRDSRGDAQAALDSLIARILENKGGVIEL